MKGRGEMRRRIRQLRRRPRRGSEILEAALVFPILLALAFGTVEFGYYFYTEHNLESAAREGVRAAVPEGLTTTERADEIESAVDRVMSASGYQQSDYDIDVDYLDNNSYVRVNVDMHWSSVSQGLRPMNMIRLDNDLVRGTATMRIEN
jgi:Flp pilus assembly protein TadG